MCAANTAIEVSDMSNNIKMNNAKMINELAELDKLDNDIKLRGAAASHDFHQFEVKKNEVNKEIIKLQ